MIEFDVVPYDRAAHESFVMASFAKCLGDQWPWCFLPRLALREDLRRLLAGPDTRTLVAVAPDDADNFLGWACCRPALNEVVFAFTKYEYRQKFGVCSTLVLAAGVDLTKPTGVRYWTRAAERIGRRAGWNLYHRVTEDGEQEVAA
jgi:hypothetical protein